MLDHFRMFAAYNRWANRLVYAAAGELTDNEYRADRGAFFGSLHHTLNHLLVADRIWLARMKGSKDHPMRLDEILFADFSGLSQARAAHDEAIIDHVETLTDAVLAAPFTYVPVTSPEPVTQRLSGAMAHMFNHQTHHRGQCHMILTSLGKPSLSLDLVYFQRTPEGRRWL